MKLTLGEKIKELRKRDGRKQEDLACALGVSNQAVSRWEKDGSYPDMEMIPAIAICEPNIIIVLDISFTNECERLWVCRGYMPSVREKAIMMNNIKQFNSIKGVNVYHINANCEQNEVLESVLLVLNNKFYGGMIPYEIPY